MFVINNPELAEKAKRKARWWIFGPIALLVIVLIAYAVLSFALIANAQTPAPTLYSEDSLGLDYADQIGLGVASPADQARLIAMALISFISFIGVILIMVGFLLGAKYYGDARIHRITSADPRSGNGDSSVVPEEIKGFSWGAAGLTTLWGCYNKVWISFLSLVPILNIVWWIVLGFKGRVWAWKNVPWSGVEEFNMVQKKWGIWGVVVLVIQFIGLLANMASILLFLAAF